MATESIPGTFSEDGALQAVERMASRILSRMKRANDLRDLLGLTVRFR